MRTKTGTLHLPNLNALRFIAAAIVLIHHIEFTKREFHLPNYWNRNFLGLMGDLGVTLFFTLSGFLITILLLEEKNKKHTIDIIAFYKRRILRIWPLYYLIFLSALFIFPHLEFFRLPTTNSTTQNIVEKLILFICMLPNAVFSFFPRLPYAVQTWSIGVEEQFYIIWPWLIKFTKNIILILSIIYVGFFAFNLYLLKGNPYDFMSVKVAILLSHLRFGCMAIGGIAASVHFFNKTNVLKYILNRKAQLIAILALVVLPSLPSSVFRMHELFALFFALLILNFAFCPKVLVNLEIQPFKYFGKISYGIYMYQFIGIVIAIKFTNLLIGSENILVFNLFVYLISFGITIGLSSLSYEFFEKKFLKLKEKFQIVPSNS
ncbi:MAG: acyltransferase [Bacteroidia bacterium]